MEFTGERYVPTLEGRIRHEHLHRYALCLELVADKSVLDIASGEGYGAALLASTAKTVIGVDIDAGSVEHARSAYNKPNLNFLVGRCEQIPLPDSTFDVVTSFETIEHHDKHEEMLDEIKRVLRPGGILIISSPNRLTYSDEPGYKNPFHIKELYYDEFHELLRRRFKSVRMFGQRLAAGSFVFPLGRWKDSQVKPLLGETDSVKTSFRELPSPIYFVAICSNIVKGNISSVYLDRTDDLFKTLERERVGDVRKMQEQVRRTEEGYKAEIARLHEVIRSYESQAVSQLHALNDANEELRQRDAIIADRDRAVLQSDDAIAQLRAHWAASEKNVRDHVANARSYEQLLSQAQTELGRHIEVLNWIYASRSWRMSNRLRLIERLYERHSRATDVFRGRLEAPTSVPFDFLEIRGWVYSLKAPVVLVEAFLDDIYLGRIRYGEERPDLPGGVSNCGFSDRISLHGFNMAGERTLKIRVYDQKGNRQVFRRSLTVSGRPQTVGETPATLELFRRELEFPDDGSFASAAIQITGWVYSKTGPIIFIEAFLDDSYLGRVFYGVERPDVLAAFPTEAPVSCGYDQVFSLKDQRAAGQKKLKLRFYDAQGNIDVVERAITIERLASSAAAAGDEEVNSPPQLRRGGLRRSRGSGGAGQEIESIGASLLPSFHQLISKVQSRSGHDPSILDWDSGFNLAGSFPGSPVFSPPANGSRENKLPYMDRTIDIVVTASLDPIAIAEARRVCSAAMVRMVAPNSMDVEWQQDRDERPLETVSIVIPVYNELNYTQLCLDELRNTLPHNFRGEIIVIDDASTDETSAALQAFAVQDPRIKVLRNSENAGFIASCNRGAAEASGEILVFLNNDTLPRPDWLPPLLRVLREKADAGAVGGKLIYPDGTLQEAGAVIFSDGSGCNFGKYDKAANAPLYSFLREVDYCSAALLATPRSLFLELGGFDTRFQPAYYEDADYCFSLRVRGYRVYYQPDSVVVHFEGASSGTDINSGIKSYQAVNRAKFVEKWREILSNQPSPPQQYDPATLQALAVSGRRDL